MARDLTGAARLFQAAAKQGLRPAVYNLAVALDLGQGIPQDYSAARQWYQWAGEHGDADAEWRLALLFEQGLGGNKDEAQARNWLLNAAEDGSNAAQVKLGVRSPADADVVSSGYFHYQIAQKLFEGKTLPRDPDRALKFVEKSAEAGYAVYRRRFVSTRLAATLLADGAPCFAFCACPALVIKRDCSYISIHFSLEIAEISLPIASSGKSSGDSK